MPQIQVKLDITANPPVTCHPDTQTITGQGNAQIEWTPFAQQSFTFVSLSGLPNPPFSGLTVNSNSITVNDNNQGVVADYSYTITVSYQGNTYSTSSSLRGAPQSAAQGGAPSGVGRLVGGGGSPTIKNN